MTDARAFVANFSAKRALLLFVVAFFASALSIIGGVGGLWLSLVPLLLYGLTLLIAQRIYSVALSATLRDSPYFLGFLLTLVTLLSVFMQVGEIEILDPAAVQRSGLVLRIGAALAPTILGLLLRQALLLLDPGEATRDSVFQSLMSSIRKNSGDFADAQARLVEMIREFSTARQETLSAELQAHERHVRSLDALSQRIAEVDRVWSTRLTTFESSMGDATAQIQRLAQISADALSASRVELEEGIEGIRETWRLRATADASALEAAAVAIRSGARELAEAMASSTASIQGSADAWRDFAALVPREAERAVVGVERIREDAQSLSAALGQVRGEAASLRQSLSAAGLGLTTTSRLIGDEMSGLAKELGASARQQQEEARVAIGQANERVRELLSEVQAIDTIVSTLVAMLTKRMAEMEHAR